MLMIMGHVCSLTLRGETSQTNSPLAYDTGMSHISEAHEAGISQILKYKGEKSIPQLFNKAQSSCAGQGIRKSLALCSDARQCLKHKNRKWPAWKWLSLADTNFHEAYRIPAPRVPGWISDFTGSYTHRRVAASLSLILRKLCGLLGDATLRDRL